MEITKSPDGFKPYCIRIDSKQETDFLWHILNNDMKKCFSEYLDEEGLNETKKEYIQLKTQFFQKLQKQIKDQTLQKEAEDVK